MRCGQLILRKISKIGATRCQTLRLKCTKFDFRWGSVPDSLGELTTLPQASKGREGIEGRGRDGMGEEKRRGG